MKPGEKLIVLVESTDPEVMANVSGVASPISIFLPHYVATLGQTSALL